MSNNLKIQIPINLWYKTSKVKLSRVYKIVCNNWGILLVQKNWIY